MLQAPNRGVIGIPHIAAAPAGLAGRLPRERALAHQAHGVANHLLACVHAGIGRVRDGAHRAHLSTRAVHEDHGHAAHERPVALVPLARAAAARRQRLSRGVAVVEGHAVRRVHPIVDPCAEPPQNVIAIDAPQLAIAVAQRESHARVVAPCASKLVMATAAHHVNALKTSARLEFERHAQSVAHRHAIHAIAQRSIQLHNACLLAFGRRAGLSVAKRARLASPTFGIVAEIATIRPHCVV